MKFYSELKRRNVFRVAIAYLAVAWLLTEVAGTLFPGFGIPDWAFRFVVIVLVIGFLPTLVFSWAYEITPEGLKREKEVVRDLSISHVTAKRLDRITIGLVLFAIVFIVSDRIWLSPRLTQSVGVPAAGVSEPEKVPGSKSVESLSLPRSIAVLPFVNMSDDASNEFFSDGISEELLNLLAKIPQLRVTSRSSAFAFKGEKIDIPVVAEKLNVAHILEGSVRKAGNRVRITAQLIEAHSDTHLWSETYDRELDDIFAIQDEIAVTVVEQLKITLLGAAPKVRETDSAAYALYLQGRYLRQQATAESYEQAVALLQQALAIDPDYAAAWNELAIVYAKQVNVGKRPINEGYALAREATDKALAINPDYAPAHANLSIIVMENENDLIAAIRHLERALQLEPANDDILRSAANVLASLGRVDEALALSAFAVTLDPVNPACHFTLGWLKILAGYWDEGITSLRTAQTLSPDLYVAQYFIGTALLFKGEAPAALEAMQKEDSNWRQIGLPMAYHALGRKDESDAAMAKLIEQDAQNMAYNIAYVLAYRGEVDLAFEWLDKAVMYKDAGLSEIPNERLFNNIHSDPRWLPFLESIGKSPEQLASIEFKVALPN
jgi:TolB-like protein/Flp pilus assembly protein TadD